jgi:AraC family L-rhamnose operon transcriptional activator RhaR
MARSAPTHYRRRALFASDDAPVMIRQADISGNDNPHDHDYYEIQVIEGGVGTHWTIQGYSPLRRGQAFLLRPGAWHAYRDCRNLRVFVCGFGQELMGRELRWVQADPLLGPLLGPAAAGQGAGGIITLQLPSTGLTYCRRQFTAMQKAEGVAARSDQIARLLLILGELGRASGQIAPSASIPTPHRAVTEVLQILDQSPAQPWTLEELASRVCLERSYLVRTFKSHTGLPPMEYLRRQRVEWAASLLLKTDLPINQVGQKVGWPDPNHFARQFRLHFGLSATEYRVRFCRILNPPPS